MYSVAPALYVLCESSITTSSTEKCNKPALQDLRTCSRDATNLQIKSAVRSPYDVVNESQHVGTKVDHFSHGVATVKSWNSPAPSVIKMSVCIPFAWSRKCGCTGQSKGVRNLGRSRGQRVTQPSVSCNCGKARCDVMSDTIVCPGDRIGSSVCDSRTSCFIEDVAAFV